MSLQSLSLFSPHMFVWSPSLFSSLRWSRTFLLAWEIELVNQTFANSNPTVEGSSLSTLTPNCSVCVMTGAKVVPNQTYGSHDLLWQPKTEAAKNTFSLNLQCLPLIILCYPLVSNPVLFTIILYSPLSPPTQEELSVQPGSLISTANTVTSITLLQIG